MSEIWLKAAHIAVLSLWAAGLLALPALIGPRGAASDDDYARRLRFTRLAFELVVSPAAIFTVATGVALIFVASWETPWLAGKLAAVGGMGLLHMLVGRGLARRVSRYEPGPVLRAGITLGVLACIGAVLGFVLGKPTLPDTIFPAILRDGRPDGFLDGVDLWGALSGRMREIAAAGAILPVLVRRRDTEAVFEHELAAVPTGEADEDELEPGERETPRQHGALEILDPMRPIEREHREQRHGDDAVRPCRRAATRAGHEHHLAEARERGGAAHQEGGTRAPKGRAGEERVERPPIRGVRRRHPERARDRKGDEHRVDRVAEQRDPAVEITERSGLVENGFDDVRTVRAHFVSSSARRLRAGVLVAVAAGLAGCGGPLSTLDPAGPAADRIATLWWVMFAGAVAILVLVCALALVPFLQARRGDAVSSRAPRDAIWLVGGGLAFPFATLSALMLYAFVIEPIDDAALGGGEPVRIAASARQWTWTFVHEDAPGGALALEGVMHVPAGRPVEIALASRDVIHSFWVPRLAGKRDAIPGRVNTITIRAEAPGTYAGICGEYCGEGHAFMRLEVVAHPPEDYEAALARLVADAEAPR